MDNLIRAAADVQELQYRVHCAVELVRAVHTTITEGANEPDENDYDALFGAYWLLHTLDVEMKETGERLWGAVCEKKRNKPRLCAPNVRQEILDPRKYIQILCI